MYDSVWGAAGGGGGVGNVLSRSCLEGCTSCTGPALGEGWCPDQVSLPPPPARSGPVQGGDVVDQVIVPLSLPRSGLA